MTFITRADAGEQLAVAVAARQYPDPAVLALPCGGGRSSTAMIRTSW